MTQSDVLREQFDACYDNNEWFVSLKTVLDGVTHEQAAWKPDGADNSIWETVNHILFWTERWLQRFRGELNEPQDVDNDTTFYSDTADWSTTLKRLDEVMIEWREKLSAMDDAKLASAVNAKYEKPWYWPLAQQNIHNAYHIGQILLLRKLQGSWDPKKGVS